MCLFKELYFLWCIVNDGCAKSKWHAIYCVPSAQ